MTSPIFPIAKNLNKSLSFSVRNTMLYYFRRTFLAFWPDVTFLLFHLFVLRYSSFEEVDWICFLMVQLMKVNSGGVEKLRTTSISFTKTSFNKIVFLTKTKEKNDWIQNYGINNTLIFFFRSTQVCSEVEKFKNTSKHAFFLFKKQKWNRLMFFFCEHFLKKKNQIKRFK